MCYSPRDIINPTKYISLKYRDRYVLQVPCGKCAACATAKSNEWTFRLYQHALDTFRDGGYVLFDTLTYDNEHLPRISDYYSVSPDVDFPCFSSRDLRLFVADLRQRCKRKFASNFSYFISTEYGTSEYHLHRPHYHVLFFVKGQITPYEFSALVAATWHRGRTDGIPFQSAEHVGYNTFLSMDAGAIRSLKYVCKYIQKSSTFQKEIDYRLNKIMDDICKKFDSHGVDDWRSSSHYWRVRESISRKISQFHRQSTFLGASYLEEIDLNHVFRFGALDMPDNEFVVKSIPLPTYYKRKLFYELVEIDGSLTWQPTALGYEYLKFREKYQFKDLSDRFSALKSQLKINFNSNELADYVLNMRGRIRASEPSEYQQRLANIDYFNYVNRYDKEFFGSTGLTRHWRGNSSQGYRRKRVSVLSVSDFITNNVMFDKSKEDLLERMFEYRRNVDVGKQRLYEIKQRLSNLVHHFFV